MTSPETGPMRGLLEIWWERDAQEKRKAITPTYPLPHDGASFVLLNNYFAQMGSWDERHGTIARLGALLYLARTTITERFLALWPKILPTIKPVTCEPNP